MFARRVFRVIAFSMMIFLCSPAHAASYWYLVQVKGITPRAQESGDVFITVASTDGKWSGNARVIIDGTSPGASKLMTVFLTAMVLNKTINMNVDGLPSFATPLIVNTAGLTSVQ